MENPFPYSRDNKRYHTWSHYLKTTFGCKVAKVALDAGCDCPNRDGTRGIGGCVYCAARSSPPPPLALQLEQGVAVQRRKWPGAKLLAYFQTGTNTHGSLERLQAMWEEALAQPDVVGLCVATRGDCLPPQTVDALARLQNRTWLVVELGLQTVHDQTAGRIGRMHSYAEFLEGYRRLQEAGIPVCIHLINGLPGETREMMLESARQVGALSPHSLKLHMLHLVRGTRLAEEYARTPFPLLTREEYVDLVCDQLERLPPQVVLQRLTGDPDRELLAAPLWTLDKRRVLNAVDRELARRGSCQGSSLP